MQTLSVLRIWMLIAYSELIVNYHWLVVFIYFINLTFLWKSPICRYSSLNWTLSICGFVEQVSTNIIENSINSNVQSFPANLHKTKTYSMEMSTSLHMQRRRFWHEHNITISALGLITLGHYSVKIAPYWNNHLKISPELPHTKPRCFFLLQSLFSFFSQ